MRLRSGLAVGALFAAIFSWPQDAIAVSTFASAPQNLSQTAIAGGVRVSWSAPADLATGITSYKVEYSTTGLSGGWSVATTLSSSTFTYDIVGLSQVATYVRVAASTSAGFGPYGYPWTKLYRTSTKTRSGNDIVYESGWGVGITDYAPTHASLNFTRIRYRMEDSFTAGSLNFADVDFYKWASSGASTDTTTSATIAPTIANLQVLSLTSGGAIQTNVSDMNVYSSIANTSYYPNAISNGQGKVGRLEIWPWDYATGVTTLKPAGDGGSYDVNDSSMGNNGYGSFQVHDVTSSLNTILAWNDHAVANVDIGFGNAVSPTVKAGQEDWTFCGTSGYCPQPNYFSLTIYVNASITPLIANSTTSLSLPLSGSKGVVVTVTATSNLSGFYTFTLNGKRIPRCYMVATIGAGPYTATCSWKASLQGYQQVTATFSNISAGYIGSQASSTIFVAKRTTTR
jgi:hypothetical protein